MTHPKLRAVVVGLGVGAQHAAAYKSLPNLFDLVAICSLEDDKNRQLAAELGVPLTLTRYEDVLAMPDVDVVNICTPPMLHRPQAIAALKAGKHVVCEKPLTDSLAGVDEMARAEAESGRRLMPVFQYRFGAGLQKVKRLVDAGLAGAPLAASIEVHWRRRADYYAVPWRGKFASELGGVLTTHAIHAVDMLTYVFGPVRSVFARTSTRSNPIEVEDCAAVVFEHANGALSTLSCTLGSAAESTRHRLVFANLTAESNTRAYTNSLDPWTYTPDRPEVADGITRLIADYDATAAGEAQRASGGGGGSGSLQGYTPPARYDAQLLRFYHAIVNNTPLPVDIGDARNAIELLSATYHSARIGAPVSLPLDASHPVYGGWSPRNATGKSS